jgi:hypothetical protein
VGEGNRQLEVSHSKQEEGSLKAPYLLQSGADSRPTCKEVCFTPVSST